MTDTPTGSTAVSTEVSVAVPIARAFEAFTAGFGAWWPRDHHIGETEMVGGVIEPRVGGRWFEHDADGTECDWGRVLVWDPPHHVGLSWHLNPDFEYDPDPDRCSRVDVRFTEDAAAGATTVVLTHSGLDRHGPGWESLATGVGSPNGWPGIVRAFADRTESHEPTEEEA